MKYMIAIALALALVGCKIDTQLVKSPTVLKPEPVQTYSVVVWGVNRHDTWSICSFPEEVGENVWRFTNYYNGKSVTVVKPNTVIIE